MIGANPQDLFNGFITEAITAEKWLLIFFNDQSCPNHDFLTTGELGDLLSQNFVYKIVSKNTPFGRWLYDSYQLTNDGLAFAIINPFTTILTAKSERLTNIEETPRLLNEFIETNGNSPFTSCIVIHMRFHEPVGGQVKESALFVPIQSTFNTVFENYELVNNLQQRKLKYMFRGRIVKSTETPSILEMPNHSYIDIYDQKASANEKISLVFVSPDGHESISTIKVDRKIKDWLKIRCKLLNLNYNDIVFTLNGNPCDLDKTPMTLNLKPMTKFYGVFKQKLAVQAPPVQPTNMLPSTTPPYKPFPLSPLKPIQPSAVNFTVRFKLPNGQTISESVSPIVDISVVIESICRAMNLPIENFCFFRKKKLIDIKNTPIALGLKSGDIIHFVLRQNVFQPNVETTPQQAQQNKPESAESEQEEKGGLFSSCLLL